MNYKLHYDKLIHKAKNRSILKSEYKEVHHIIPKCLGGSNDKSNLVSLFADEHLIAHLLLSKIYPDSYSLLKAAYAMTNGFNYGTRNFNKEYSWLKEKFSKRQSIWMKENHYLNKMSINEREIFIAKKCRGKNNSNYGNQWDSEQRAFASDFHKRMGTWKGEKNFHYGKIGKLSPHYGKKQTEDHKAKKGFKSNSSNPSFGNSGAKAKEAKHYILISPDGLTYKIFGTLKTSIKEFCETHNLNYVRIKNNLDKGKIKPTYKAYKNVVEIVNCECWEFKKSTED